MDELLDRTSKALNERGIRGSLLIRRNTLVWRGYFTDASGARAQKRIHLGLRAHLGQLLNAEKRVIDLASAVSSNSGVLPERMPWDDDPAGALEHRRSQPRTVAEAVELLESDFWTGKTRNGAAERTWDRVRLELRRLPQQATITTDLLVAVARSTETGSRTRLEACKVFKRLGKLAGLEGLERLDELRSKTQYRPERRDLPTDEELQCLLNGMPPEHQWSWPTWALVTFGCRPSEVFSLKPQPEGIADVLTIKLKNQNPEWRTALALPVGDEMEPPDNRVWRVKKPAEYDSLEAKRLTGNWGKWLKARAPGLQLYDLRHAWAIRSIHRNLNPSLAAKCMGHSLAVHSGTYHRELNRRDVAAVAEGLRARSSS
jgi:hypothetical protein